MKPLDVIEDIRAGLGTSQVLTPVHTLALEHAEEAFCGCIVGAAADCTHAANEMVAFEKTLILVTGELTAAVGMQDHRCARLALPPGHARGLQDYLALLAQQACDAIEAARCASITQLCPHARATEDAVALTVQSLDALEQSLVILSACTGGSLPPSVIPARRDL